MEGIGVTAVQVDLTEVKAAADVAAVGELLREYAAAIGLDLDYGQAFLPGTGFYALPLAP